MGKIIKINEGIRNNPINELHNMLKDNYCYQENEILTNIERLLNVLEMSGISTDSYNRMFYNLVNNYKKLGDKALRASVKENLYDIGTTIIEQCEDIIKNYYDFLKEGGKSYNPEKYVKIKKLAKKVKELKEDKDSRKRILFGQLMLTASLLIGGFCLGPTVAKIASTDTYGIEKDIDSGEEQKVDISRSEYVGQDYVRKYGKVFFDNIDKKYYRDIVDYYYSSPAATEGRIYDLSNRDRFGKDEIEIEEKVGRKLDYKAGKVELVKNTTDDTSEKIVTGKQFMELDEEKAENIEKILKLLSGMLSGMMAVGIGYNCTKMKKYDIAKEDLEEAIENYGLDNYNKEEKEIHELRRTIKSFKRNK